VFPAMLGGLVVGYIAARSDWGMARVVAAGAALFVVLVWHQSTAPQVIHGEGSPITAPLWVAIGIANVGGWAFGTAIGAAWAWSPPRGPGHLFDRR
jgi:hypothetical protein